VFATSCGQFQLPSIPADPDNGEPGDIRRIKCYTPDPRNRNQIRVAGSATTA
jgi:hypothetical protein